MPSLTLNKVTVSHPVAPKRFYHLDITPGESIRLYGDDTGVYSQPTAFDKTFKIGDQAEYDSYNLSYYGPILSITDKTVTISAASTGGKKRRLSLSEFAWRNCTFDLTRIKLENDIERQSL